MGNNPVRYVDPDGRKTETYWTDGSLALKKAVEKTEEIIEKKLHPKPSGNFIKGLGFWGSLFYICNNVLQSDSITPALPANYYRGGNNIYAPDGTVMATVKQAWAHSNGDPDWDNADGCWGKGTFANVTESLIYHFEEHGKEVGAASIQAYINKALGFKQNLKRVSPVESYNKFREHTGWRYEKNGKYIILDLNKDKILSYGRIDHIKYAVDAISY